MFVADRVLDPQRKPVDRLAWPQTATSDGDGRLTIHGIGRNLQAMLTVEA